jgi:excisionase family DNA binding protein
VSASSGITFAMSPEAVELIARRAAELVLEQQAQTSPWLTTREAAEYLRWPQSRIEKLAAANAIPRRKHEGRNLFHRAELDEWLEQYREGHT